ncbi:MAG: TolC family protein [Muribaculaceae bacterium]|nr:TolC family protein [Muribaculaceae bacterium]
MTINVRKIVSATAISFYAVAVAQNPATFSLDDCIAVALSQNPTVTVADMEVHKADYSRKETLGRLLPSLSFDGSYNRTLQKQVAYMDLDAFPGMGGNEDGGDSPTEARSAKSDAGFKMGLDNMYSLGFQLSVPVIAPQLWASLKISDQQIARAAEQARASRLDMVNQVKNAYYALQLAHDSRRVVRESYDMAALTHDTYVKRHALGDASEYEVLRASVAMKNIEPQMLQCEIAVKRAHLQLAVLMGIEAETPFDIAGHLADYEGSMYNDVMTMQPDLSGNTSLAMNTIETKTLERTLSMEKAAWWPTLSVAGNYSWNSSSNGSPFRNFRWTSYSMVGVSLSIPIFQGGQRYNRIKQARIQLDEMSYTRDNLTRNLNSQATLAIDNIKLNVKQIASSKESVGEAERANEIQNRSFEIGATSYLDLRDSQLSLTQARLSYCQAIYNYLVAASDLELLLGNAPVDRYLSK